MSDLAQLMSSWFVSWSLTSGSVLTTQSLEPASDSVSPSLSAPPPLMLCLSLSLSKINTKKLKKKCVSWYLLLPSVTMQSYGNIIDNIPCAALFIPVTYLIAGSLCLLIPFTYLTHPPITPLEQLPICSLLHCLFVRFLCSRFHMFEKSWYCLFLSHLFHLA